MYVAPDVSAKAPWRPLTRVAFRFVAVYFTLYVLFTQMLGGLLLLPYGELPDFGTLPPMRLLVTWTATHLFRVTQPLVVTGSGSGDKTYDWVLAFCLLTIAAVATVVWTALDRRAESIAPLKWFRLFLRFALGSTILFYGLAKVIPLQMPTPTLTRLLEPFGNFSPMGVLWSSIGTSRSYEIFTGVAEATAGILLFIPGLTTLGALLALADMVEVFMLNMTYDVPVKLFSFHLILMSLVLLAPDSSRLLNVLVLNRAAAPSMEPPLFTRRRAMRIAAALQLLLGVYLLGTNVHNNINRWREFGGGAPKPALFGIWSVDEAAVDGTVRPPLLSDEWRWRRLIVQNTRGVSVQQMNDAVANYPASIDPARRRISFANGAGAMDYEQPSPSRLVLDGTWAGHRVHMQLRLVDARFLLVSRGFHWVQEYPFNR